MANLTMAEIRENGLFEDAKEKYENTSKSWKSRWWAVVCDVWENFTHWQDKYDLDMDAMAIVKKVVKRVSKRAKKTYDDIIEKVPVVFAKGTKLCYLFKFYDDNDNLVYSKVGTTTQTIYTRLTRELHDYRAKGDNIKYATIESVFNTNEYYPEGAESIARAMFIKKFNKHFIKNDRFTCDIDVNEFNAIVTQYLA